MLPSINLRLSDLSRELGDAERSRVAWFAFHYLAFVAKLAWLMA